MCDCSLALLQCEVGVVVCWKKFFFIGLLCMSWKSLSFSHTKSFPFAESFILYPQKPLVFATKTPLIRTIFYCCKSRLFYLQKPIFCTSLSLLVSKTAHFHKPKVFLLYKSFLNCYPKQLFSTLHLPFAPPLTYCLQRIQPFFCCSL